MKYYSTLILLSVFALSGCFSEESNSNAERVNSSLEEEQLSQIKNLQMSTDIKTAISEPNTDLIYAKVGKQDITKSEIDKLLKLRLFDLEWAAYELRLQALSSQIRQVSETQVGDPSIEVLIEPPWPPRLEIEALHNQPRMGRDESPITLSIFCSYPSSHCAKMTPIYKDLIELYPGQIKVEFFDFPQKFHFNAGNAAVAARCANDEGKFWRYHQGLYSRFDALKSNAVFIRMAEQVGIDKQKFSSCLENSSHAEEIKKNMSYAESLWLTKVPVTLINGLYINGPRSLDILRYYIDKELASHLTDTESNLRLVKSSSVENDLPITKLPIRLEGISYQANSDESIVTISKSEENTADNYRQDDEIFPDVYVVMIRQDDIIIENNGSLEKLILQNDEDVELAETTKIILDETLGETSLETGIALINGGERDTQPNHASRERKYLVEPEEIPEDLEYTYRGVVDPKGETPLSREWINNQLVYRQDLETHFEPAEMDVEGYKLMRLNDINENNFYQTLGLQDKDVIMRVNEQWVHSAQNGLFDKLENEEEVSIIVMRKGLPVHIQYAIN